MESDNIFTELYGIERLKFSDDSKKMRYPYEVGMKDSFYISNSVLK